MTEPMTVDARPKPRRPLSIWDLPGSLLKQPHNFRKRTAKRGRERKHQAAILAFIYRNRFATASQVQRRFEDFLKSDRTTRRHLAEMQESLGHLDVVPTPSPLWPKVYGVSRCGVRKLARAFKQKNPTWELPVLERTRDAFSIHHVLHELFITEFLLSLWESAARISDVELLTVERRSLAKHPAFALPGGSSGRLIPDAMFLLRQANRGLICTFLEIDTGSMSLKRIAEKLERYSDWATGEYSRGFLTDLYRQHGAKTPRATFRIAWACGSDDEDSAVRRAAAVKRVANTAGRTVSRSLWLTTTGLLGKSRSMNVAFDPVWFPPASNCNLSEIRSAFLRDK